MLAAAYVVCQQTGSTLSCSSKGKCPHTLLPAACFGIGAHYGPAPFVQGQRRLELFGEDHNIRPGWVTIGKDLSGSNFNPQVC